MESGKIAVKIAYQGEVHRLSVDLAKFTLTELKGLFTSTFMMPPCFSILYKDNEGDMITVTNDIEFVEACRVFMRVQEDSRTLSFVALSQCRFKDAVAPVVKAVEEFAEQVSTATKNTLNHPNAQEFSCKCKKHLQDANEALCKNAKQTAEFLAENGQRLSEAEFLQKLKQFADEIRESLAEMLNQDSDEEEQEEAAAEESQETPAEDKQVDEKVEVASEASTTSSGEWENVQEQVEDPKEEEMVDDLKWATEFGLIVDVFPEVSYERAEEMLERFNGNMHVVMNALMDL